VRGSGCGIHPDRPRSCRDFFCSWLVDPNLGPEWKPDKAKFLTMRYDNGVIIILVDPATPAAWRDPRYYGAIKTRAARALEQGGMLSVHIGRRLIVVLPDRDQDMGLVPDDHTLRVHTTIENGRPRYHATLEANQPG